MTHLLDLQMGEPLADHKLDQRGLIQEAIADLIGTE